MSKSIGIEEARKILGDLVTDAQYGHTTTITKHGKPVARIVPIEEPDMTTTTVSREAIVAWLGDRHGLTPAQISNLRDKADEIGRAWPLSGPVDVERRMDRLWWAYQDIVTAAASSQQEALDIIHAKRRTGVDPWATA